MGIAIAHATAEYPFVQIRRTDGRTVLAEYNMPERGGLVYENRWHWPMIDLIDEGWVMERICEIGNLFDDQETQMHRITDLYEMLFYAIATGRCFDVSQCATRITEMIGINVARLLSNKGKAESSPRCDYGS